MIGGEEGEDGANSGTVHENAVSNETGIQRTRLLNWFYLDDGVVGLRNGVDVQMLNDFLADEELVAKYGLRHSLPKQWTKTRQEMEEEGGELLGSWVGGPDSPTSGSAAMFRRNIAQLERSWKNWQRRTYPYKRGCSYYECASSQP